MSSGEIAFDGQSPSFTLFHYSEFVVAILKIDLTLYDHCMFWAAFCVAFFDFIRPGEFTVTRNLRVVDCLQISDLSVDSISFPNLIRLRIKVSKADLFRKSCTVIIGRHDSLLCPV